jgi:hypothetical protein
VQMCQSQGGPPLHRLRLVTLQVQLHF